MDSKLKSVRPVGWYAYLLIMLAFNALIWVTPVLAAAGSPLAAPLYTAFGFTCHQLDSRSLCYYNQPGQSIISDCLPQDGALRLEKENIVIYNGAVGYKVPVCARDLGIYGAMFLGGLLWPLLRKPHSRRWPAIGWLVLAMLPTAIDGTTQLLGWRESSNLLRLWTGAATGVGLAFFLIPACNAIFNRRAEK